MRREWSDPERVADYLSREIPHRELAEELLLEALPERVERFLDLGTGDGRLLDLIRRHRSEANGIGVDVSRPMLDRARRRFDGVRLVELCEHDLATPLPDFGPLDAVVSALAIHHLSHERKRFLFGEIHSLLRPGGVFVNLDLTTSPTPELHLRFREAIGRIDDDPADRLAGLGEQLDWLRDAGFDPVDCRFKWLELTLFVAARH
jgi:SAM-dependent methyltransferase